MQDLKPLIGIAFWSEQTFPGTTDLGRISFSYEISTREQLQTLTLKWGTPNLIHFLDGKQEPLLEGRDWTRREQEKLDPCFDDILDLFPKETTR